MKVRDVMTTDVVTATPDTTLEELATMMKSEDTGAIPVLDKDELVGIVTDRDIVLRCIAEGKDPAQLGAQDVLSENLEQVEPDTDIQQALEIMGRLQIRRLPVVSNGEFVGMVSLGDLAVKQGDQQKSGEALKDVSRGVKASRRAPQPATPTHTATRSLPAHAQDTASTGITHDRKDDRRRPGQVVPFRLDANAVPRRQKKSGKRRAS